MTDYHEQHYRTLFLTVGDYHWGSSRIRSYWPAEIMPEATAMQWKPGVQVPTDYDAYIWLKVADIELMEELSNMGKVQFVEVCDPNWWHQPKAMRKITDLVTAVVSATELARLDYLDWYGTEKRTYVVPDRMKLEHYPIQHQHSTTTPTRLIWYGMHQNRVTLYGVLPVLERLAANGVKFELTLCDNKPTDHFYVSKSFPIYQTEWTVHGENQIIAAHDIALVPPYPGPWGPLKTNNRTLTAWACGIPAVDGYDYYQLHELCTNLEARKRAAEAGKQELLSKYRIDQTVDDWRRIIATEMELKK